MVFFCVETRSVAAVQNKNGKRPGARKIGHRELLRRIWARLLLLGLRLLASNY